MLYSLSCPVMLNISRQTLGLGKLLAASAALYTTIETLLQGTETSLFVGALLGLLLAFAIADAVVNDLLPAEYSAPRSGHFKYLIFVGIGALQMPWMYLAALEYRVDVAFLRYALTALACAGVAILDFRVLYCRAVVRDEQGTRPTSTAA